MTAAPRLPWFPCEPGPLLGALAGMPPSEGYVYCIVLFRIYECGGPCPDSDEAIARRTGFNRRVVSDAMAALCASGRLVRTERGIINPKAAAVLDSVRAIREKRKTAGEKGGFRSAEIRQRNQTTPPSKASNLLEQNPTQEQLQLQEQGKIEGTGGETPPAKAGADWPSDYREKFWAAYPRKTEKKAALAKLDAVRKSGVHFAALMAGVDRLNEKVRRERTPEKYIKHPTTWLNRGCWEDQFNQGDQNEEARRPREDNIFTLAAGFKARGTSATA